MEMVGQPRPTLRLTLIGGATVLLELAGVRLLTDPTFDPAGSTYEDPPVTVRKLTDPAVTPEQIGRIDAVLLSHDEHSDNLDHSGRGLLPRAGLVLTTPSGAQRLGGNAFGLELGQQHRVAGAKGPGVTVSGVEARHGPPGTEDVTGPVTGFLIQAEAPAAAVYVSGDTVDLAAVERLAARARIAVALLHLGAARFPAFGDTLLSFDAASAVRAARALAPATIVALHAEGWEHFSQGRDDVELAFSATGLAERLLWPSPGQPTTLGLTTGTA